MGTQKIFYSLGLVIMVIAMLYVGKTFLILVSLSLFLWLLLSYFALSLQEYVSAKASIWIVIMILLVFLGAVTYGFGAGIAYIQSNLGEILSVLDEGYTMYQSKIANQTFVTSDQIANRKTILEEGITIDKLAGFAGGTLNGVSTGMVVMILSVLLLTHERRILSGLTSYFGDGFQKIFSISRKTIANYCYGLLLLIMILFVLNTIGLFIFGVPNAIFVGGLTALATLIPTIGTIFGGVVAMAIGGFTSGSLYISLGIMIRYLLVQQLEDYYIKPKIIGEKVSLNTLAVIFSLVGWGILRGIPGLFLALPIMGIIQKILEEYKNPLAEMLGNKPL